MDITFQSSVIFIKDLGIMKDFYLHTLMQEIEHDFGNCLLFKGGFTLWSLQPEYPLAQKMGTCYYPSGNKNLELCFETESFDEIYSNLIQKKVKVLHDVEEERWGQKTFRFYDPEDNLIEVGESIPCFVKRFYAQGMTVEEVAARTSVSSAYIEQIISTNPVA
ncbi:MAG: hypothetical protein CVU05_15635 [Bacteroidetes bacterium HGW-Bacteroidetes-21]|jgi:catechol 2,3-dioxygenase-like lactoylglutathione lyase family enzyme|nr:MAG: hypothetical protein CVU05_15635 [Bacteroidetes bacterium HGW-Bacteroidetes-21]